MIARNAAAAAAAVFFLFCLLAFPSASNSNTLGAPAADWGWICAGRRRPLVGNGERLGLHASSSTAGCGPVRSGAMALFCCCHCRPLLSAPSQFFLPLLVGPLCLGLGLLADF
uniref:Uncharacterized protein n=1 Tax=Oryza nivara TaxID=4536 RepID=A0A0E0IU85_ORYNI